MFKLLKIENARMNVPEPVFYEAADGEAISVGEALVLEGGKLTKCGAAVKPEFIAIGEIGEADTARKLAVCRVESNQVYEAPVTDAPTSLKAGDKVTLSEDALGITATTDGGIVTVVSVGAAIAAGDTIVVRIN